MSPRCWERLWQSVNPRTTSCLEMLETVVAVPQLRFETDLSSRSRSRSRACSDGGGASGPGAGCRLQAAMRGSSCHCHSNTSIGLDRMSYRYREHRGLGLGSSLFLEDRPLEARHPPRSRAHESLPSTFEAAHCSRMDCLRLCSTTAIYYLQLHFYCTCLPS